MDLYSQKPHCHDAYVSNIYSNAVMLHLVTEISNIDFLEDIYFHTTKPISLQYKYEKES